MMQPISRLPRYHFRGSAQVSACRAAPSILSRHSTRRTTVTAATAQFGTLWACPSPSILRMRRSPITQASQRDSAAGEASEASGGHSTPSIPDHADLQAQVLSMLRKYSKDSNSSKAEQQLAAELYAPVAMGSFPYEGLVAAVRVGRGPMLLPLLQAVAQKQGLQTYMGAPTGDYVFVGRQGSTTQTRYKANQDNAPSADAETAEDNS